MGLKEYILGATFIAALSGCQSAYSPEIKYQQPERRNFDSDEVSYLQQEGVSLRQAQKYPVEIHPDGIILLFRAGIDGLKTHQKLEELILSGGYIDDPASMILEKYRLLK